MQKPVIFLRLKQKHFSFSFSFFFVASSNSTSLPSNRNDSFGRAHRRRRSFLQKGFTAAVSRRTAEILDPVVGLPGIIVDPVIRRFPKVGCRRVWISCRRWSCVVGRSLLDEAAAVVVVVGAATDVADGRVKAVSQAAFCEAVVSAASKWRCSTYDKVWC